MLGNDGQNRISVPKNTINEYWIAFSNDAHGLSPIMSKYHVHKKTETQNIGLLGQSVGRLENKAVVAGSKAESPGLWP